MTTATQRAVADAVLFHVARVAALGRQATHRVLSELDLTVRSYSALSMACDPEPPTQKSIAEYLLLDPSQVVAILDELERRELVTRLPDPSDRRARLIVATADGRALHARAHPLAMQAEAEVLANLSRSERELLLTLLSHVERDDGH